MVLAPEALRLAESTARDLHARGEERGAAAVEALLAFASSALTGNWHAEPRVYFTPEQAARATGIPLRTLKGWIESGQLQVIRLGTGVLVHQSALEACFSQLRARRPAERAPTDEEVRAQVRQHESLVAGLDAAKVARLEALHDTQEEGGRLTRAQQAELRSLERELMAAAANLLRDRIRVAKSRKS